MQLSGVCCLRSPIHRMQHRCNTLRACRARSARGVPSRRKALQARPQRRVRRRLQRGQRAAGGPPKAPHAAPCRRAPACGQRHRPGAVLRRNRGRVRRGCARGLAGHVCQRAWAVGVQRQRGMWVPRQHASASGRRLTGALAVLQPRARRRSWCRGCFTPLALDARVADRCRVGRHNFPGVQTQERAETASLLPPMWVLRPMSRTLSDRVLLSPCGGALSTWRRLHDGLAHHRNQLSGGSRALAW